MHQLQVVDEDHVDAVAHLGLAGLQLKAQLVHHGRVVDVDLRFAKWAEGIRHAVELSLGQQTAMHALRIDLRLLSEQALGQLFFGHLEAEDRDRLVGLERRVERDVQGQRCVVNQDVLGDEVVSLRDGEVINLVLASRLDGNDLVPIDLIASQL